LLTSPVSIDIFFLLLLLLSSSATMANDGEQPQPQPPDAVNDNPGSSMSLYGLGICITASVVTNSLTMSSRSQGQTAQRVPQEEHVGLNV